MLGEKPLVLLTRAEQQPEDALDAIDTFQLTRLQRETVALSRKGERRFVANASHHIELDAPDVVADAILDISARLTWRAHHNRPNRRPSSR